MLAEWLLVIANPFLTLPVPAGGPAAVPALTVDPVWFQPRHCLSTRCGDEEWRREIEGGATGRVASSQPRPRLPGNHTTLPLRAPARTRESRGAYSNDWRIGTRYGYQMVNERDMQLGIELGAGYRIAPLHDDGVATPGPVFRGGINLGRRFGERAQWTQRLQFETGNGEHFARQTIGVDVELAPDWMFESDYVIRYDSRGASGSETAEAWFGVRRRF
ncbi:MAG TPA: DUF481 domain-containing protein [Lysobacter sp.]|nr:DUF481 domain-containing protein [Lysobacter sp.]